MFWRRRHPIADQELSAYVDGQLPSAARVRLEEHVQACAACREALEELRALRGALRELPSAVAPRSFALREADVRGPTPRAAGALGRAGPLLGGVTAAAIVAFGALVSVDVGVLETGSSQEPSVSIPSAPEEADADGPRGFEELAPLPAGEETIETNGAAKIADDRAPGNGAQGFSEDGGVPLAPALTPECPDCPDTSPANQLGGVPTPECPDCPDTFAGLAPALTPDCPPTAGCVAVATSGADPAPGEAPAGAPLAPSPPTAAPAVSAEAEAAAEAEAVTAAEEDDGRTSLRVAEAATAALALIAASSLALVWWRRRA